jgi:hypothetical protein
MHPYKSDEVARGEGISCAVREALADPIVQALLVADRVDPQDVADLSRRMAARLSRREAIAPGRGSLPAGMCSRATSSILFGPSKGPMRSARQQGVMTMTRRSWSQPAPEPRCGSRSAPPCLAGSASPRSA